MGHKPDRMVYRTDKGWANKRNGASRPEAYYPTQREAVDAARENLRNAGGGELSIKGVDQRIREKNTIALANDPFPPRG